MQQWEYGLLSGLFLLWCGCFGGYFGQIGSGVSELNQYERDSRRAL